MTHSFSVKWPVFMYICSDLESATIKSATIQIKSYRLLFIFLHSKEYISLSLDLLRTDCTV